MTLSASFPAGRIAVVVGLSLGCGGDLTLPDPSGAGLDLSIVAGNGQTGTVGEALAQPLVVKVAANGQTPVGGRKVAFIPAAEGGELDPDTAITNSKGEAFARWVLGTRPGEQEVEARLVVTDSLEPPVARFEASVLPGSPDTVRALSPLHQPGRQGQTLADPLVVRVVDRYGNPVTDSPVAWQVTAGGGSVSDDETPTASDGTAQVTWTLGNRIGVQKVTANVGGASGSPVTFTATVLF